MEICELISLISKKTGAEVNQSQFAEALGIKRQTVSTRIKNRSQVTVSELKKAEEYFGVNLSSNTAENLAELDYYNDVFASCGNGSIIFSEQKTKIAISSILISNFSKSKKYSVINASGNSMAPTIENGDKLIIEHWSESDIQDNKIYVFCFNNEFYVKRLCKNFDEIIIKSDNPEYRTKTMSGRTAKELTVIGKIVGIIKSL